MIRVKAPATSANLGSGFDVVAVAFELWNELEVGERNGTPPDLGHLDRIPRERGLGSSAAVVALGLVAGALAAGTELTADELLAAGLELEGHPDNLAAALAGGVCLTWDGRIARIAEDLPAAAIAVIPRERVRTTEARAALPAEVRHADAAFSVARAALLGAALAAGDAALLAASADDRLHEPYRAGRAPHLAAIRDDPPRGALGAALSGSGPTVVVWAEKLQAGEVAAELAGRFPEHDVVHLAVATTGAGSV
jgi:homoserine kinase